MKRFWKIHHYCSNQEWQVFSCCSFSFGNLLFQQVFSSWSDFSFTEPSKNSSLIVQITLSMTIDETIFFPH